MGSGRVKALECKWEMQRQRESKRSWDMSPCSYYDPASQMAGDLHFSNQRPAEPGQWGRVECPPCPRPEGCPGTYSNYLVNPVHTKHSILSGHRSCQLEARTIFTPNACGMQSAAALRIAALSDSPSLQLHQSNYYCEVRDQSWLKPSSQIRKCPAIRLGVSISDDNKHGPLSRPSGLYSSLSNVLLRIDKDGCHCHCDLGWQGVL